jgi:exonuclease III
MSCLSWNCRGLGNTVTVKELRKLVKRFASAVLCVQETQVQKVSGSTIRGTQIMMKNNPASPFNEKDQQKRDGLNSPLLLQQDM